MSGLGRIRPATQIEFLSLERQVRSNTGRSDPMRPASPVTPRPLQPSR